MTLRSPVWATIISCAHCTSRYKSLAKAPPVIELWPIMYVYLGKITEEWVEGLILLFFSLLSLNRVHFFKYYIFYRKFNLGTRDDNGCKKWTKIYEPDFTLTCNSYTTKKKGRAKNLRLAYHINQESSKGEEEKQLFLHRSLFHEVGRSRPICCGGGELKLTQFDSANEFVWWLCFVDKNKF